MTEAEMNSMDDVTVDNAPMPTDEDLSGEETATGVQGTADSDTNSFGPIGATGFPQEEGNSLEQLLRSKAEAMESADRVFNTMKAGKKFDRKDVMKVLYGFRKAILISDQLLDLAIQDLMVVDQRFGNLEQQLFQMVQQVSTVTTTLFNKEVISKDDVKDTWEKEIKPAVQQKLKDAQDKMAGAKPVAEDEELSPILDSTGVPVNAGVNRIEKP